MPLNFSFDSRVRSGSALARYATTFPSRQDSSSLHSDFALLISAHDFVTTTADTIRRFFPTETYEIQVRSVEPGNYDVLVRVTGESDIVFLAMIGFDENKQIFAERRLHFSVTLWGGHEQVRTVDIDLRERFGRSRLARIMWWYKAEHGPDYRSITMEPPEPIHDSFYPWIEQPVNDYLNRYLESSASVLFLMGEPGTGKTSLIRHFIYEHQLQALITYEEKLINSDEMFVDFLAQDGDAVLVIEDAESLLGAREIGGNSLMARFLNVSDGLIRMAGKKIIFTTNQNDFRSIDPALVRPGRSFDALRARPLTHEEACRAAADAGMPAPKDRGDITLADLFNPHIRQIEKPGIGIGR
ncbi:MAG: ATP-binding protein [Alphaproteobacteria bacterium]|nr:ATP-binding protein [Alphaproteobacteria bacterium]